MCSAGQNWSGNTHCAAQGDQSMTSIGNRMVPTLLAADLTKTTAFYETLGFARTGRWPEDGLPTWIELARDGIVLQFHSEPPAGTPGAPIMSGTLYLYPDDVAALAAEFSGKVELAWGPEEMPYGMHEFGIRDPNGYYLAFTEPA